VSYSALVMMMMMMMMMMMFRPLHDAVETDNLQMVRLLLASGADVTLVTYSEKTVFSLAQSLEMKEFLHG
jgi:hypothetical protein